MSAWTSDDATARAVAEVADMGAPALRVRIEAMLGDLTIDGLRQVAVAAMTSEKLPVEERPVRGPWVEMPMGRSEGE